MRSSTSFTCSLFVSWMVFAAACGLEEEPLARIDGVPVLSRDAEDLRVLLQPAPSSEGARRLAVDAALAHRLLRGSLAGSSAKARYDAYRELLADLRKRDPELQAHAARAVEVLAAARARWIEGRPVPVPDFTGEDRERRRLARVNEARPLFEVEDRFLSELTGKETTHVITGPLAYFDAAIAEALEETPPGTAREVEARDGRHVVRVLRKIERGALR